MIFVTAFLVIMIVPFPFAAYIDFITGHRYRKAMDVIYVMIVANFTVMSILHFCGIADFSTTMPIGNTTIAIVAVFLFVVIIYDTYVLKHKENSIIALGYSAFTLLGIIEIIHLNLTLHTNDGIFVAIGLMLLLVNAVYYEVKRISEMRAVTIEAQKANNAKTTFLANMSHEIRTPINAILGMDELILREDTDPKITEYARNIKDAGNALLEIISDVLDFSKIEQGKMEIINAEYDTRQLINNIITMISVKTDEKGLRFERNISDDLPSKLIGDEKSLREILINLLGNAVKYTQKGSICFTVKEEKTDEKRIDLCISVKDTGIGIKDEDKSRLFMQFERFDHAKNRSIEGTGLGLAISANLIKLMGGTIECQSEQGKGTTFTVVLDIPVADRQRDEMKLDPVNVLIVDDDEITLKTTADTLVSFGASAEQAGSGKEALGKIEQHYKSGKDYDIIIVDWKMPDIDGVETIRRIRSEIGAKIPILLISAYDRSDVEEKAKEAGANGIVNKPLFPSTLYDTINALIGKDPGSIEPEEDYSDLEGMKILVAEDNDINWEIVSAMLSMFGITTERAENGRVCVDMVSAAEEGCYEMILMDVQMPEMNGLDATREIRNMSEPKASIPIIAVTADAFSENVTECLNAGMNGHISKPIDMKLVIKEIRMIREGRR